MQKSRLFFILTIITITITVILISLSIYYNNQAYDIVGKHTFNKEKPEELIWEEKYNIANEKADVKNASIKYVIGAIVLLGATTLFNIIISIAAEVGASL